jgi:hypothetical protein
MDRPTEEEIANALVHIISDGFNRSLGALEDAGAVNTKKMRGQYLGIGSKYYDLITLQIEMTARFGARRIRELFDDIDGPK